MIVVAPGMAPWSARGASADVLRPVPIARDGNSRRACGKTEWAGGQAGRAELTVLEAWWRAVVCQGRKRGRVTAVQVPVRIQ